jgi:hypothetical protein
MASQSAKSGKGHRCWQRSKRPCELLEGFIEASERTVPVEFSTHSAYFLAKP